MRMFIFLLLLCGCGKPINSYLQDFEAESAKHGRPLKVYIQVAFVDVLEVPEAVGICQAGTITLQNGYWNKASEAEREFLIFHELGHCILKRPHVLDWGITDGHTASMMMSFSMPIEMYIKYHDYYMAELFKQN